MGWPSCSHSPKTLSFRHSENDVVFKTLNSVYFDSDSDSDNNNSNNNDRNSNRNDDNNENNNDIESIVRGAHSETTRLFFEPSTGKALSVLLASPAEAEEAELPEEEEEGTEKVGPEPFQESVVMAMESEDPYADFKRSMQEMMEAHGLLKDWACLEELLAWYLRVNGRKNHAYIVAAFVDLLVKFSSSSSSSNSVNSTSSLNGVSSCSTSRSSSSSCGCAHCKDHQSQLATMAMKSKSKSTTSFSSAASSFSSDDN